MNPNGHRLHWCWLVTRPSYRSVPLFVDKLYSCQVHVQILITIFSGGAFVALRSTCEFNTTKELGTEKTDKKNHHLAVDLILVAIQLGRLMMAKNVRHLVNHFICDHNYDDGRGMNTCLPAWSTSETKSSSTG